MPTQWRVNEIFCSPQGEGARQGDLSVFVRFTGCNLRCAMEAGPRSPGGFDCDTEFMSGRWLTTEELIAQVEETGTIDTAAARAYGMDVGTLSCDWVVLTGGEPLLQVTPALVDVFKQSGYRVALETNGSREIPPGIDWVAVSPKVAEHCIRAQYADELRYVRGYGQALPRPKLSAKRKFISPAFDGTVIEPRTVEWCKQLIAEDPSWELSIQAHKLAGLR